MSENKNKHKIIVVGNAGVGKTSFIYRYCTNIVLNNPRVTVGMDLKYKTVNIDGENINLTIWDTAGMEQNRRSMAMNYYRNAAAVIIMFDVTRLESFDSLSAWIEECRNLCPEDAICALVGNKCDSEMQVPRDHIQKFADDHNMAYFETSSHDKPDNANSIFMTIAHKLKNKKNLRLPVINMIRYQPPTQESCSCSLF